MQLSVLFSALVSFVLLAAASPTPGVISKLSSKRENLDISFQRDLLGKNMERELQAGLDDYDWDQPDKKRELAAGLDDYDWDQPDKKRELAAGLDDYDWDQPDKKRELAAGLDDYDWDQPDKKR